MFPVAAAAAVAVNAAAALNVAAAVNAAAAVAANAAASAAAAASVAASAASASAAAAAHRLKALFPWPAAGLSQLLYFAATPNPLLFNPPLVRLPALPPSFPCCCYFCCCCSWGEGPAEEIDELSISPLLHGEPGPLTCSHTRLI